jgi:hypothetical protein
VTCETTWNDFLPEVGLICDHSNDCPGGTPSVLPASSIRMPEAILQTGHIAVRRGEMTRGVGRTETKRFASDMMSVNAPQFYATYTLAHLVGSGQIKGKPYGADVIADAHDRSWLHYRGASRAAACDRDQARRDQTCELCHAAPPMVGRTPGISCEGRGSRPARTSSAASPCSTAQPSVRRLASAVDP